MRKILSVIKREYLQIVKTKGFIISTVLGPVLMIAFVAVPVIMAVATKGEKKTIAVADATGQVFAGLDSRLAEYRMADKSRRFVLEEIRAAKSSEDLHPALNRRVLAREISGYILVPENIFEGGAAEFASQHVSDFEENRILNQALTGVIVEKRLTRVGLDPGKIAEFTKPVELKTIKVTEKGQEEETGGTFAVSYVLVIILYTTVLIYGSVILRGVIEEKNTRVVEVVLSSLKPFELMMGKILGIGAVGLTQYAIWALFGGLISVGGGSLVSTLAPSASGFKLPTIPAYIFIYFAVFFLLGYFLYSTLYAALASMVNSEKEAQHLVMPVTMALVIPMLMMVSIMKAPSSPLSIILSLIPFFAPVLMLMRITILLPPFPQILASILLLVGTILLMVWLAAKIYRVGVLMYGKRPSVPEIIKWVRYK